MSNNEKKPITRKEFEEKIIAKTQSDKEFKKSLVDNPQKALEQLNIHIPQDLEVKVVEESAKVVYLVLPINPDELTDGQLDQIAGGSCVCRADATTVLCPAFASACKFYAATSGLYGC